MTKITCTLQEDQYTFLIVTRLNILIIKNVSDKGCRKNQKTIKCSIPLFKNRAVYEIMRKNNVEQSRPHTTTRRMRITRCIPKDADTHSEYVILIAFPRQQWLHERATKLRLQALHCLSWVWFVY
jgi:hypothetical protein